MLRLVSVRLVYGKIIYVRLVYVCLVYGKIVYVKLVYVCLVYGKIVYLNQFMFVQFMKRLFMLRQLQTCVMLI